MGCLAVDEFSRQQPLVGLCDGLPQRVLVIGVDDEPLLTPPDGGLIATWLATGNNLSIRAPRNRFLPISRDCQVAARLSMVGFLARVDNSMTHFWKDNVV